LVLFRLWDLGHFLLHLAEGAPGLAIKFGEQGPAFPDPGALGGAGLGTMRGFSGSYPFGRDHPLWSIQGRCRIRSSSYMGFVDHRSLIDRCVLHIGSHTRFGRWEWLSGCDVHRRCASQCRDKWQGVRSGGVSIDLVRGRYNHCFSGYHEALFQDIKGLRLSRKTSNLLRVAHLGARLLLVHTSPLIRLKKLLLGRRLCSSILTVSRPVLINNILMGISKDLPLAASTLRADPSGVWLFLIHTSLFLSRRLHSSILSSSRLVWIKNIHPCLPQCSGTFEVLRGTLMRLPHCSGAFEIHRETLRIPIQTSGCG